MRGRIMDVEDLRESWRIIADLVKEVIDWGCERCYGFLREI